MKIITLWEKLKEMIKGMLGQKSIEQVLHISPTISGEMSEAINLWDLMYKDKAPWLKEPTYADPSEVKSLGLPAMIASEKARMVTLEMQSEITAPIEEIVEPNPAYIEPVSDEFGNVVGGGVPRTLKKTVFIGDTTRAEYLNSQYKKLLDNIERQVEYGIAKGGLVIKPFIEMSKTPDGIPQIYFDYIQADGFYPISFDASGRITEAAFTQRKQDKDTIYTRLEYHKLEGTTVTVINKAFKLDNANIQNYNTSSETELGKEINLKDVPEWSSLQPETTIQNVDRLLFAYFKMPIANNIDTYSPLGISAYSRAVKLIEEADKQYSRLLWEFEGGELALDVDINAISTLKDKDGNETRTLPKGKQRLFRKLDLGQENTYFPYAPGLRDVSFINGLNTLLMRIEDVCGISRGTLSDVSAEAKTATELKILKQRSFAANAAIQSALQTALEDVVYIMNVYCTLYEVTPEGEYNVSFEWDDSIITDVESELGKRITLQHEGITSKLENRMWYFGETEQQAQEALMKVQEENTMGMEAEMNMPGGVIGRNFSGNTAEPGSNSTEEAEE